MIHQHEISQKVELYRNSSNSFCSILGLVASTTPLKKTSWGLKFYEEIELWNITIDNFKYIQFIHQDYTRKVYAVENPSVFQLLSFMLKEAKCKT